jgi:flagellar assembly protein FliH
VPRIVKSVTVEKGTLVAIGGSQSDGGGGTGASDQDPAAVDKTLNPEDLLSEAQKKAEEIVKQAEMQSAAWEEQARQAGWQAGYEEGLKQSSAEMSQILMTARNLAQSAVDERDTLVKSNPTELGRLAVSIAERLIGRELSLNPSAVSDIVAQVIETSGVTGPCRIRINPEDHEVLKPHWDAIAGLQKPGEKWELVPDQTIQRGGCVIDAGGGTVDARLGTQLERVQSAFENMG